MKSRFRLLVLLTGLYLTLQSGVADDVFFKYNAEIESVTEDGFYKLLIAPEVINQSKNGGEDIRIFKSGGDEVSYLFQKDKTETFIEKFVEYPWEIDLDGDSLSIITIQNQFGTAVNNICLFISNAEVVKNYRLSGSNDQRKWFVIKDFGRLVPVNRDNNTQQVRLVDFPLVNYRFLKLEIDDRNALPLQINKVGYYETTSKLGKTTGISCLWHQHEVDDRNRTSISIQLKENALIDYIQFTVSKPIIYNRTASVYYYSHRRKEAQFRTSFELSSKSDNVFALDGLRCDSIDIRIDNQDNAPLVMGEVMISQQYRYCVAWLEKDERYVLKWGNNDLRFPKYDLAHFKNDIPDDISIIKHGESEEHFMAAIEIEEETSSVFSDKRIIWGAIIIVMLLLVYSTINMMKDKKDANH